MSIKYYHLAKDEELPEEFCAIRDEGGEPNGYVFYVPESEVAKLREQTELLVTLLRNDCDIDASWDGLRHFWSIELTEDGCLMRDRACKAEAENAKLREFIDLKETCWKYVGWCDECPYNGVDDKHDDCTCMVREKVNSLASELGVEVPS